jgi:hypothetical protein
MTNYRPVLNRFINSDEFAEAIITRAKTKRTPGSNCMVEFFPDETWTVGWFEGVDDDNLVMRLLIPELSAQEFQELKDEVGTDNTQELAEALRKKDIINKMAEILRRLIRSV